LPCVGWYSPPPFSFPRKSLKLEKTSFPTTTKKGFYFQ
jgi:hypothetical protein